MRSWLETREVELVDVMVNLLSVLVRTETGISLFAGTNTHWMFTDSSVGLKLTSHLVMRRPVV